MPTEDEMKNGLKNLEETNYKVDYIISHCCSASLLTLIGGPIFEKDILIDYFQQISKKCEFKKWFFGQYHDYRRINLQYVLLYEDIILLDYESYFQQDIFF